VSSRRPSCGETMTTGARAFQPRALVVRRHHLLVRISHWLNIPLLLGLILSGISIYWASPIYQHPPNPTTGSFDYFADAGIWIVLTYPGCTATRTRRTGSTTTAVWAPICLPSLCVFTGSARTYSC
jgi:hypothetical protein